MAFIINNNKSKNEIKTQSEWAMKESSLYEPVKEWLKNKGYDCYSEVPFPTSYSFIDIVGKKEQELICIELKTSLNKKVIYQAHYSQMITQKVYVGVASSPSKKSLEKCQRFGIGVLSIKDGSVIEILPPSCDKEVFKSYYNSVIETLSNGGFDSIAGLPNMKGTGPAQAVLKLVKEAKGKNPKISWKELFDTIPNHYSSPQSMAQSMGKVEERTRES